MRWPSVDLHGEQTLPSLEAIQQRLQEHAARLQEWDTQFQAWKRSWEEREERLERELANLERGTQARSPLPQPPAPPARWQLLVVSDDDEEARG